MNPADGAPPRDYVFGYGSLIQAASRAKNLKHAGGAIPARVAGLRRAWNTRGPGVGFTCTFLGVTREEGATTNGVLTPIDDDELAALDRREEPYDRIELPAADAELLAGPPDESRDGSAGGPPAIGRVLVYETRSPTAPSGDCPLLQSYVDICLAGCFEVDRRLGGDAFTAEFLRTTEGWSPHWVNDRLFPRAAFRHVPEAGRIDRLLHERAPAAFAGIRIE